MSTPTGGISTKQVVDWTDLGKEMWSYLTGKGAAIDYTFVDMAVEVPRDTGADAPRATWKLNGTLRITTRAEADAVVVEIADSGAGLDPAVAARAFDAFYTTKDIGKGTGLGLDTARRIVVENHEGTIALVREGDETVVRVRLPR